MCQSLYLGFENFIRVEGEMVVQVDLASKFFPSVARTQVGCWANRHMYYGYEIGLVNFKHLTLLYKRVFLCSS